MRTKKDFNTSTHTLQKSMLQYAIGIAEKNSVSLDYSDKSIRDLDKVAERLAIDFRGAGLLNPEAIERSDTVRGMAQSLGFYIVECIERNHSEGVWLAADPISKEEVWCLSLRDHTVIYPFDWLMKKFINPENYSLTRAYAQAVLSLDDASANVEGKTGE